MLFRKPTIYITFIFCLLFGLAENGIAQFGPLELTVSSGMGVQGSQVCLDVTAKNFTDVESIQFNLSFNGTLVVPVCPASYVNPLLTTSVFGDIFSCLTKNNGYINFVWADNPTTIPDNEVIFTLCFDLIGNAGNISPVYFNGLQLEVEVCKQDATGKTICNNDLVTNVGTIMIKSNTLVGFSNKCDADGINGTTKGSITFYATGGTAPYSYSVNAGEFTGNIALDGQRITLKDLAEKNYTIVITDAAGTMYTLPVINVSNNELISYTEIIKDESCVGRKNGYIALRDVKGGISPYTFEWSNLVNGVNLDSLSQISTGKYTVTITDAAGCILTDSFELKLDTLKINVDVSRQVTCKEFKDGQVTITATGGTPFKAGLPYEYQLNGNNWIRFSSPTILTNIASGNFTLLVRDSLGCSQPLKNFVMTVAKTLNLTVAVTDETCSGAKDGTATLTCSPYSDQYFYRFLPNFPSLGVSPKTDTFKIINITEGSYGYSVIDPNGCKDSVYFDIKSASKILLDSVIIEADCNTAGSISLNPKGGTPPYTFNWNPSQPPNTSSINNLPGGTYSVTVSDKNNCNVTFSKLFNTSGTLNIQVSQNNVSCFGKADGNATVTVIFANGPIQMVDIFWRDANNVDLPIKSSTINNLAPGDYTVEVIAENGCKNTIPFTITEPPQINITLAVTNAPCFDTNGKIVASIAGNQNGLKYEWRAKVSTTIIDTDATLDAKAGDYTLTVINGNNCSKDTTITITEQPKITLGPVTTNKITCFGRTDGQAAIMNNPSDILLNWSNGVVAPFIINLPAGKYWVVGKKGICASDTTFFEITSFPVITLDTTQTELVNPTCFGDTNGSIKVQIMGGTGIGYKYKWTGQSSTTNTLTNIPAGGYEVILSDDKNCEVKDTIFLVQPDKLIASVDKSKTVELDCNNQDQGKISLTTVGGNPGIKTYLWASGIEAEKETAVNLSKGTYCATVSDNRGCKDTVCYTLTAPLPLVGELNTPATPLCNGGETCISVKSLSGGTGSKYTFQINNGKRYPLDTCVAVYAGSYFVNLIDSAGCSIDTIITIGQPDPVAVDLGDDQEIQLGLPSPVINALIDSPIGLDTLVWTPTDSLTCLTSNCQSVLLNPASTTTYILTVTDLNGCTGTDDIIITVKDVRNVYFANVFSPNGDGSNDYFQAVTGPGVDQVLSFAIFDRWGNRIFDKSNYQPDPTGIDGWDGTFKGTRLDPGVFVYYANVRFIDGKVIEYKGSVTIADKRKN